ncbi:MAG TPA: alpha/beta hydrolase [Dehalococcoidia bacterium]|nr:alpha/beta hydrolase [Dehalococcoidia bacterium]
MPYLEIEDFRLYYNVDGKGPAIAFLHGAGGNHLSWWRQIPYFRGSYTCITLDQRAFGLSRDVAEGPGRRAFGSDLKQLLDHLGIGDVALVAHSMGGRTAAGFILRAQDPAERRVWALVLSGTHGGVVTPESRQLQEQMRQRANGRSLRERALAEAFVSSEPELAYLYGQISRLNPPRPDDFLAPIPGYLGTTLDALSQREIPVMFVTGTEDEVMSPEAIRMAAAVLPGAELKEIIGAGHSAYFERPDEFNSAVGSFLARHAPATDP